MDLVKLFDRLKVNKNVVYRFKVFSGDEMLACFASLDDCLFFLYEQYFKEGVRFENFKVVDSETNLVFWPNETSATHRRIDFMRKIF